MALVNCSECKKEISDKANSCPHCGNPIAKYQQMISVTDESNNYTDSIKTKSEQDSKNRAKNLLKQRKVVIVCVVAFILFIAICFVWLTSSRSSLNETNQLIAKRVITVIDNYLDGKASLSQVKDAVDRERLKVDKNDVNKVSAFELDTELLLLSSEALKNSYYGEDVSEIKKYRNRLAKLAGMRSR